MRRSKGSIYSSRPNGPVAFDIVTYNADLPILAFSFRKVSSSYGGNIIKLRRSSDNATSDFTATHGNFVNFAAITTWRDGAGAATAFVDTWYDQSGNNYHITRTVLAEQPEFRYTGQPFGTISASIKFDGVDDTLFHDAVTDVFCNNQATIYSCYRPVGTAFSSMMTILALPGSPSTNFYRANRYSTVKRTSWNSALASAVIGVSGNNEHCIDYWDGTNAGYNIDNGAFVGTIAVGGTNNEELFLIGGSAIGGSNPFDGWMCEILWFDVYQSSLNRDTIRNNQNSLYTLF